MLWVSVSLGLILVGYLLGSMPTGYLAGRFIKGIDIRQYGSGGTGATNVLRTLGKKTAIWVLLVDVLKGAIAVFLARWVCAVAASNFATNINFDWSVAAPWIITLAGLAAVLGHSCSVWINFTGGKSVATGLGVIFTMAWTVGLAALLVFAIALGLWRIVSLSSILAAIATMTAMFLTHQPLPYQLLAIVGGGYVIWRHRTNIRRLFTGQEPKIGQNLAQEGQS